VQLRHCGNGQADMMEGERFFRRVQQNCWDPETRIKDMDAAGVIDWLWSFVHVK